MNLIKFIGRQMIHWVDTLEEPSEETVVGTVVCLGLFFISLLFLIILGII